VDNQLLTLIKEVKYLKYQLKTQLAWSEFKRKRNETNNLKSQLKKEYFQNTLSENKHESKLL